MKFLFSSNSNNISTYIFLYLSDYNFKELINLVNIYKKEIK